MTTYSVLSHSYLSGAPNYGAVAIRAVTWPVRFTKADYSSINTNRTLAYIRRHEGSTISGGTALTPTPLQQGAPAATATARSGSISASGTQRNVALALVSGAGDNALSDGTVQQLSNGAASFQPAIDLIIAPGDVFFLTLDANGWCNVTIYFEELRLNWSY